MSVTIKLANIIDNNEAKLPVRIQDVGVQPGLNRGIVSDLEIGMGSDELRDVPLLSCQMEIVVTRG